MNETEARWRALWSTAWERYEATLAIAGLGPLREIARAEVVASGETPPVSDAVYLRSWWEASRWRSGGVAPKDYQDRWDAPDAAREDGPGLPRATTEENEEG